MTAVAVVGHVEWATFARVPQMPRAGEIVHASASFEVPGGGGAVAGVQLAKLAGECVLYTALADDELGHLAARELEALGLRIEVAWRSEEAQRQALVHVDGDGERTITVLGKRHSPSGDDPLPWQDLAGFDGVYLTAGDAGAIRAARTAGVLVGTVRAIDPIRESGVRLDAIVASSSDAGERYSRGGLDPEPDQVVRTEGAAGGSATAADGTVTHWAPAPLTGPARDAYGAGDSFAAGLTYGLGAGFRLDRALELGARCGAACVSGDGPYAGQLHAVPDDLSDT